MALFSGLSSVSTVPAGSLANAALVGANTVNGPAPLKRVDQAGGLHRGDQRGVVLRVDGVVDDVLGRDTSRAPPTMVSASTGAARTDMPSASEVVAARSEVRKFILYS